MRLTKKTVLAEIPTSSMADIAFLLIIYFMLTATFAATRGLDFQLPEELDAVELDPVESIYLRILTDGALTLDGRPVTLAGLLDALRPKLAADSRKPVIVHAEPSAPYGQMVAVLDELRQGKDRLSLDHDVDVALPTERERAAFWR